MYQNTVLFSVFYKISWGTSNAVKVVPPENTCELLNYEANRSSS